MVIIQIQIYRVVLMSLHWGREDSHFTGIRKCSRKTVELDTIQVPI